MGCLSKETVTMAHESSSFGSSWKPVLWSGASLSMWLLPCSVSLGTLNTCHYYNIVHWFISETTLNLPNLNALLKNIGDATKIDGVGIRMNIPRSKLNVIKQQHSNFDDSNCACWELYLEEHPSPTWQRVAHALYMNQHLEELEVVLKKYLKGEWAMIISIVCSY